MLAIQDGFYIDDDAARLQSSKKFASRHFQIARMGDGQNRRVKPLRQIAPGRQRDPVLLLCFGMVGQSV